MALISLWVVAGFTSQAVEALTLPHRRYSLRRQEFCFTSQAVEALTLPASPASSIEATPTKSEKKFGKKLGRKMGRASWYGPRFHGKKTANGERFNQNRLTAAYPSLPLGTQVEVTNLKNGRTVWVRINDRGPYVKGRVIDLSHAAAQRLGMLAAGTTPVSIEVQPE